MEQELLELWSAVEKDKAAARERALAARRAHLSRLHHLVCDCFSCPFLNGHVHVRSNERTVVFNGACHWR